MGQEGEEAAETTMQVSWSSASDLSVNSTDGIKRRILSTQHSAAPN